MAESDPIEVLKQRALARAKLWAEGYLDFHDAVDRLQFDAVSLASEIGQGAVQLIIAEAFDAVRREYAEPAAPDPFRYDDDNRVYPGVAASTIAAVEYLIKLGDQKRLTAFLGQHTAAERRAIRKYFAIGKRP
jgi:hypothetical protein